MRRTALLITIFALALAAAAQSGSDPLPTLNHFDPNQPDKSADPCTDFFEYACRKWTSVNPIPADQATWSTASPLQIWNESVLRQTLEKNSPSNPNRNAVEQKIGDYYAACMDLENRDASGIKPIAAGLAQTAALKSKAGIVDVIVRLHSSYPGAWQGDNNQSNAPLFGFSGGQDLDDASLVVAQVDQGGPALPGRDFYLKDDQRSKDIRAKYQEHVKKMFVLAGEPEQQATADAGVVLAIETDLARAQMDNVKRRDPKNLNNKMSLAQLRALTPSFDWPRYFKALNTPATKHYLVSSPDYFRGLETALRTHPLDHWKTYLRWHELHGAAPYLSKPIIDENFDMFARTLFGSQKLQPQWRRCVRVVDRDLGEALGQAYVDRAFPPESKQRMLRMVKGIEDALGRDIQEIDWMTPGTKQRAQEKLKAIEEKIGYPNRWRDYSSVKVVPKNYPANVAQATAFEFHRNINKIGKPVDRSEWQMTPPTINAYYDPQLNTINFPAGILQPPFFDADRDEAVNYGAIGVVIGHEITHGFDDQGRKFDAKGNLQDWWTEKDAAEYEKRGKCIADQYTEDVPELGVKTNGLLTQGEDTADNGGLRIAFMALTEALKQDGKGLDDKGADGWTPRQRFFLSYANQWCGTLRPQVMRTVVLTNPHSLNKYRVNNVISNSEDFAKAFSCKAGQPMARQNACRVW